MFILQFTLLFCCNLTDLPLCWIDKMFFFSVCSFKYVHKVVMGWCCFRTSYTAPGSTTTQNWSRSILSQSLMRRDSTSTSGWRRKLKVGLPDAVQEILSSFGCEKTCPLYVSLVRQEKSRTCCCLVCWTQWRGWCSSMPSTSKATGTRSLARA